MFKTRSLLASFAALALCSAAISAQAATARTHAPAPAPVAASAETPAQAPTPAGSTSAERATAARKDEDANPANAELDAAAGDPQPGTVDGPLGSDVSVIEAPPTHVDARVLADCEFGKPNDLASVPSERVEELEASFVIDTHPAAVDFARRLAAGEIQA